MKQFFSGADNKVTYGDMDEPPKWDFDFIYSLLIETKKF